MNHAMMHFDCDEHSVSLSLQSITVRHLPLSYATSSTAVLLILSHVNNVNTNSKLQHSDWSGSFMHCTLMPHKSYYGDIYRLGLGSYWYIKTINITLTYAKLSKPVGPRVSLSNSYSWRRIIAHHLCSNRES